MKLTPKFYAKRSVLLILTLFLAVSMSITGMFLTVYGRPNRQVGQTFKDKGWKQWEYIPLKETIGINRSLEPAEYVMEFEDGKCRNASKEIRVAAKINGEEIEVPSQVYNVTTYESSGYAKSCIVAFLVNCTALSSAEYFIYYDNPDATKPTYATDLIVPTPTDTNITVANSYYVASLVKDDPAWKCLPSWINYIYYKLYSPTENLARDDWKKFLITVLNVGTTWYVPWAPIEGTNISIIQQGPVFIEVESVLGRWAPKLIKKAVITFRFYARIPWFIYSVYYNLTGADFAHLQIESYVSKTALFDGTYRKTDGSITAVKIGAKQGDLWDWDAKNAAWIDVGKTNTTDNPVGIGFIGMAGTDPWYTAWHNDLNSIAPFANGSLIEARQNLVILFHKGNYIETERLYKQIQKLLLPSPMFHAVTSITVLATVIDKVSGGASPDIYVEMFFRENGTRYNATMTNEMGTAIFKDVPAGNYTVRALGESVNITVTFERAYWGCKLRVMVSRFTSLIYMGIGIGVCIAIIAVISVVKRRK